MALVALNMQQQASRNTLTALDHEAVIIDKLNSSRMQRFFGVEIESSSDYQTNTIKNLYNNNQRKGTRRRHRRSVKRRQGTAFQTSHNPRASSVGQLADLAHIVESPKSSLSPSSVQSSTHHTNSSNERATSRLVSWFNRLQSSAPQPSAPPAPAHSADHADEDIDHSWRPLLPEIYAHPRLLLALQSFMERIFCVENLLFLQSARRCHALMDDLIADGDLLDDAHVHCQLKRIDFELHSIFDAFIAPHSKLQINVSYDTFTKAMADRLTLHAMDIHAKRHILVAAVEEIEKLVLCSVLSPFYESTEFSTVAQQRLQRLRNGLHRGQNQIGRSPFVPNSKTTTSQPTLIPRGDEWSSTTTSSHSKSAETGLLTISSDVYAYDDEPEVRAMSELSMNCLSDEETEEDVAEVPVLSMLSKSASSPPIKLNMSHSTESAFSCEFTKSVTSRRDSSHLSPGSAVVCVEEARARGSSTPMPTTKGLRREELDHEAKSNPFSPRKGNRKGKVRGRAKTKALKKAKRKRGNPFSKKLKKKKKQYRSSPYPQMIDGVQSARTSDEMERDRKLTFPGRSMGGGRKAKKDKRKRAKGKTKKKKRSRSRASVE